MIAIYTDFGERGPYTGQIEAVLAHRAPGQAVIRLMSDAPAFAPKPAAYLLAAITPPFPAGTVFLCVVDPGVGTHRRAVMLEADGRWYVGPDNGLLSVVARRAREASWHEILWRPEAMSASFHGRDLFAPVAAMLATGHRPEAAPCEPEVGADWPEDLAEVIHVDAYGNLCTGLRTAGLPAGAGIAIAGRRLRPAIRFADVAPGSLFWYANAQGLVEIAANQASAATLVQACIGTVITVERPA